MVGGEEVQTTMYDINKLQRHTAQHRECSRNFKWSMIYKNSNHYVVHLKLIL